MPLGDRRCPCSKWLPLLAEKTSAVLFLAWVPQLHPQDKTWFGNLDSLDPPLEYLDPRPVKHRISHSKIIFKLLESFCIHFGNSSENVTWICKSQNFVAFISFQWKCLMWVNIPHELISWELHSSLERERKICSCLFTLVCAPQNVKLSIFMS